MPSSAAISSSNFQRQLVMHGATSGAPSLRTSTAMFRELDSHENLASIDQSAFHGASQMATTFGSPIGLANWSFKPSAISPLYQSNLAMLADLSIGEVISVFFKKPSHMCPVLITTAYHAPRTLEQLALNEHKYTPKSALVALSAIYLIVSNYWEPMKTRMNASPASFDIQKSLMELLQALDRVVFRFYLQALSNTKDTSSSTLSPKATRHSATHNGTLRGETVSSPSKEETYISNLNALHTLSPASDDTNNTPHGTPPTFNFSSSHIRSDSTPANDAKSRKIPKMRIVLQMTRLLIDILYRAPFQCFLSPYRCWLIKETQPEFRQMLLFCARKDRQIRVMSLSSLFEAITSPSSYGAADKADSALDKSETEKSVFLLYFWFCDLATCSNEMSLDMSMLGKMELVGLLCLAAADAKCRLAGLSLLRHLRLAETDKVTLQHLLENHTASLLNSAMARLARREPDAHQKLQHFATVDLWERFKADQMLWYFFLAELCKSYSLEDNLLGCATTLGNANFDALHVVINLFEYYSAEANHAFQASSPPSTSPVNTLRGADVSSLFSSERYASLVSSYVAGYLLILFALPHERQVDFVGKVLQSPHFHTSLVNPATCKWAIFAVQSATFHALPIFVDYALSTLSYNAYSGMDRGDKTLAQNAHTMNPYHAVVCTSILGELVHAHVDRFETFTIEERTDKANPKQRRFTRLQRLVDQLSQLMSLNLKILSSEEGALSSLNLTLRTYCFSQAVQLIIALALVQAKTYDVSRAHTEEMVQEILGAKLVWISKADKMSTIQFLQVELFNHNVACCTYLNQAEAGSGGSVFKPMFLKHHRTSVSSGSKNALFRSASNGSSQHQYINSNGSPDLATSSSGDVSRQHSAIVSPNGSVTALNLNRADGTTSPQRANGTTSPQRANGHAKASSSSAAHAPRVERPVANGDGLSSPKYATDRPKSNWASSPNHGSIVSPSAQAPSSTLLAPPSYTVQSIPMNGPNSIPQSPGSTPMKSMKGGKSRTPQPISLSVLDSLAKPLFVGLEELSGLTLIAWETLAQIGLLNAMELPLFSSSSPMLSTHSSHDPARSRSVSGSSASIAREKVMYSTPSTSTNDRDPYDPSCQFTPRGTHVHSGKESRDRAMAPATMQKLLGLDKMRFSLLKWLLHYQRRDYKVTYESLFNLMLNSPEHRKNYIFAIAANVVALPEAFSPLVNNLSDSDGFQDPDLMLATYYSRPMPSSTASHLILVPKISSRFFSLPLHMQLIFPCVLLADSDRITRRIARDMLRAIVAQHPEKKLPVSLRSEAGANLISDLEGSALATAGEIAEMFSSEVPLILIDCLEKIPFSSPLEQSWLAHLVISFGIHVTPLTVNILRALYDATKTIDSRLDATFGRVWGSLVHTVRPSWREDLKLVVHFLINDVSSNRSSVSKILLAIYEVSDEHALRITSILLGVLESKSIVQLSTPSTSADAGGGGTISSTFGNVGPSDHGGSSHFSPETPPRHPRRQGGDAPATGPQTNVPSPSTLNPTGIHYTTASLDTQQTIEALVTIIDSNIDRLLKTAPRLVFYSFLNFRDPSFSSLLATILERASLAQEIAVPIRVDMCYTAALLRGNVLATAAARAAPTSAFSSQFSSDLPPNKRRSHHYHSNPSSTLQPLYGGTHSQSSANSIHSSSPSTHSALNSARGNASAGTRKNSIPDPSHDFHGLETTYDDPKDWTFGTYILRLIGWLRLWDTNFASRFFDVVCEYVGKCANKDIVNNHVNLATALQIYRAMLDEVTWPSKSEDVSDQTAPLLILITDLVTIVELEHNGALLSESCLSFNSENPLALEKSRYHESLELSETLASFTRCIFSSSSPHTFWALVALLHSKDRNLFSYAIRAFWMLRFHTLVLIDGPKFDLIPTKYWHGKGIVFTCAVDRLLEALDSDDIASEEPNILALALTLARSDLKLISGGKDSTLLLLFVAFIAFFWNSLRTPSAATRFVCHSFSSLLLHLQQKHGQLSARGKTGGHQVKTEKLIIPGFGGGGSENSPYKPLVDKSPRGQTKSKRDNRTPSKGKTEKQMQTLLNELHTSFDRYVDRPTQSRLTALVECISDIFLPAESQLLTDALCKKLRARPAQAPALLVLARTFLEMAPTTEHFPKLIATAFELSMDSRYSGISFELQRLVEVAPLVSVTPPPPPPTESPMATPAKLRKSSKGSSSGSPSTPRASSSKKGASSSAAPGSASPSLTPSTKARASPVPPIPQLKSPTKLGEKVSDDAIPLFPSTSAVESTPPKTKSALASTSMKSPGSPKIVKPPVRSPSGSPALESKVSHAASPTKIDLSRIAAASTPSSAIKSEKSKKNLKASFSIAPPLSPSSYKVEKRQFSALEDHALGFGGVRVPSFQTRQNSKVHSNGALSDSESESDSESTWHCMATHMLERVLDALEGEAKKLRNDLRSRANSVATVASPRNGMSPVSSLNLGLLRHSSDERLDGDRTASPASHTPHTPYQPLPTVHTDDDAASELEVATFLAKQKKKSFFRRTVANNRPILDSFVAEGAWPSSTGSGMLGSSEDSEDGTRLDDSALLSPLTHRSSTPPNLTLILPYNTNYNPKSEHTEVVADNLRTSEPISNAAASSRLQPNVYRLVRIEQPLRLEMDQAAVLQMCNDHLAGDEIAFKTIRELRFSSLRELYPHISSNFGHLPSILKLLFNLNEISEATLRMLQEEEPLKNPGIFAIVSLSSPSIYLIYVPPKDVTAEFEENARRMCYKLLIEAGKSHFFFSTEAEALRLQSIGVADPRADPSIDDEVASNKTGETPTAGLERFDSGVLSRRASMTSLHSAATPQPHGMQHSRTSLTPLNVATSSASTMNVKLARPLDTPHVSSAFQIALPSSRPHATTPILATGASNLLVLPEKVQQNTKLDMSSLIFGPDAFENTFKSTSPKTERKLATPSKSGAKFGTERSPSKVPMSPVSAATGAVYMQGSLAGFVDGWVANGGRVKLFPDFVNDATQMIDFFRRYSSQVDAEMLKVEEQLDLEVQSLETDSRSSILAMIEYFLKTVCPIEYRVVHQFTSPGSTDAFDEVREAQVAFFQNQLLNSVESSALTDSRRKYYEALYIINAKERKLVAKGKPRLGSAQKAEFIERLLLSPRAYKRALSKISDKAPLTLFVNENLGNEFLPIVTAEIQDFIIANYNAVLSNAVTTFIVSHRDTFVIWAKQHYEIDARQKLFDLLVPAYNQLITSNPADNIKNNRRFSSSSNPEPVSARAHTKMPNPLVLTIYRFMPVVSATTSSRPSKRKEQGAIHKQPASPSSTLTQRRTKTESKTLKLASPRSASQSFELTFVEEKIEGSPRLLYSSYHIAVGESETAGKLVEARSKPFWTFTHCEQLLSVLTLKDGSVYSFVYDKKANETVVYVGYSKDMVARKSEASRFAGLCTHIVLSPRQKLIALTIGNSIRVLSVDATFVPIFEFDVAGSETHILDIRFAGSSRLVVFFTQGNQTYFQVYFMELVAAIKAQNSHNSKAQKGPRVYIPPSNGRLITPNGQYLILLDDMLCAQVYDLSLWLKPPNFVQDELTFTPSNGTKADIAPTLNASSSVAHSAHSDMHSDDSSNAEKGDHHILSAPAFTLMLAPKFHSFVLPSRITLLTVTGQLYLVGLTDEVLEFLTLENLPGLGATARSLSHTPALAPSNEIIRASLAQSGRSTSSLPVTSGRPKERSNLDSQIWCILDLFAEVKGSQAEAGSSIKTSLGVNVGGGSSRISELASSVSTATTTGSTEIAPIGIATENILHFVVNGLDTNGMARHSLRQLFKSVVTASPVLPRSFSFFVSAQASLELLRAPLVLRFTHKQAPAAPHLGKWFSDLACATSPQVVSADAGSFTLKALSITSPIEDPDQPKKSARRRPSNENDFSAFSAISGLHALLNDWQGPVKIVSIVGTGQRYETMAQTFRQVSGRFARLARSARLSTGIHASTFEQEDGSCLWVVLDAVWPGDVIGATHFERQILLFLCAVSSVILWHSSHADSVSTISQLLELMDLVSEQAVQFKTNFNSVLSNDAFMPALFQGKLYVLLSDVVASSQAATVATEFKESFRKVKKSKRRGADFCSRLFGSNLPSLFLYPDTDASTYKSSIDTLRTVIGALPPTAPSGPISAATLVLALETASQLTPSTVSSANNTPNRTMHREKKVSPTALQSENSANLRVTKVEMPPIDALLTNLEHAMQHGVENDGHQLSIGYGPTMKLIDDPVVQIGGLVLHDSNFDMYSAQSIARIVDALKDANVPKTELHYEFAGLLSYLVNRRLSRMATWMDQCLKTEKSENPETPSTPISEARISQSMLKSGEIGRSVDEDEDKPVAKRTGEEKDVELDVSSKSSPKSGNEDLESKDNILEEDSTSRMLNSRKLDHEGDPKFEILVQSFETLREQLRSRWEICNVKCGNCSLTCSIPRYFHEKLEFEDDTDEIVEIEAKVSKKPSRAATLRPEQATDDKRSLNRTSTPNKSKRRRNSEKSPADRKIDLRAAGEAGVEGASQKYHELYLKHDCGTDHACSEPCHKCGVHKCRFPFGHGKSDDDYQVMHECGEKHPCTQPCRFAAFKLRGCAGICGLDEKHPSVLQPHDCGQPHQCNQYCAFCDQYCKHLFTVPHRTHACAETECKHSCQIHHHCSRPCTLGHQHTEKHYCGVNESNIASSSTSTSAK